MKSSDRYAVEVLRQACDLGSIRQAWEPLPSDPNSDPDFYLAVIAAGGEGLSPYVITLKQGEVVKSILLGRIEKTPFEISLGYKRIAIPGIRLLTLVHGGQLGEDSEPAASLLVESVQGSLRNNQADVACFHAMEEDSALCHMVAKAGGFLTRDYYPESIQRWRIRLPKTFGELVRGRSSNTRHNLNRYTKRLQNACNGELTVRCFHAPGELDTVLTDTEAIASTTYHRGLGVGFINDSRTRRLMSLALSKGWLRASILYIGGKPVAFWNGFLYRRTFFTWTTGYNPSLSEFRPGSFLLQRLLADLCDEGVADEVDFGFGDAQYKQDWSDYCRHQVSQLLFSPTVKGVLLNCLRTPLVGASNAARSMLARTGTLQKIKKLCRNHFETKSQSADGRPRAACTTQS